MAEHCDKRQKKIPTTTKDTSPDTITTTGLRDPLAHLNQDVLNLVFEHLSIHDLVSCERLNRAWQRYIQDWFTGRGRHYVLRQVRPFGGPGMSPTDLKSWSYAKTKECARHFYQVQSAHAKSVIQFDKIHEIGIAGDFVTWISSNTISPTYNRGERIYWQSTGSTPCEPRVYQVKDFLGQTVSGCWIQRVLLNKDGVLLVNLKREMSQGGRFVAYSPAEDKKYWEYAYVHQNNNLSIIPLLLGQSLLYCAVRQSESALYDFAAYRFGTGEMVYHTPILSESWYDDYMSQHHNIPRVNTVTDGKRELIYLGDNEEFIVQHSPVRALDLLDARLPYEVNIIRGRDGQIVHTIRTPICFMRRCIIDPFLNQTGISLVLDPSKVPDDLVWETPILDRYRISIFRELRLRGDGRVAESDSTIVITTPDQLNYGVVDPFNMVCLSFRPRNDTSKPVELDCCPLVDVVDADFSSSVKRVAEHYFPGTVMARCDRAICGSKHLPEERTGPCNDTIWP
ncbi:hypothetical protein BJX61DRAFT_542865 [Aspergillus egyptiacus]|nr:hypothetical protein BJX61DRAFT_542865 [Aspergillus egyptiacus]